MHVQDIVAVIDQQESHAVIRREGKKDEERTVGGYQTIDWQIEGVDITLEKIQIVFGVVSKFVKITTALTSQGS